MNVVFAGNYLNIHQRPFCDEMIELLGEENFRFIARMPFNQKRLTSGYEDMNQAPFVIRAYEDLAAAEQVSLDADVLIGIPYFYPDLIRLRMEKTDKLTFACAERLLKRGLWFRLVPQKRKRVNDAFTCYSDRDNFHVLCASAFTSSDLSLFGFPTERCWKWGYFPVIPQVTSTAGRPDDMLSLLWVGRLLDLKRPFEPLRLVRKLASEGMPLHLTMVGDGELRSSLASYVRTNRLEPYVTMTGAIPNSQVHELMSSSHILLFTSNRNEGWGAVLCEAMGNGCVPVASSLIGSVPFLIEDGVNGRVFPDGNSKALYRCVAELAEDRDSLMRMSSNALETMRVMWNPKNAAKSVTMLSDALLAGSEPEIAEGPCSPAGIMPDTWYGRGA